MGKPNQDLIMDIIRREGPISRPKLSRLSNLSLPTVSRIVNSLLQKELLIEAGKEESSAGRKAVLLDFNSREKYVIGAEVGELKIKVALADLRGNIQEELTVSTLPHSGGDITLNQLLAILQNLMGSGKVKPSGIQMMGVGVPSPVDRATGKVVFASTIDGWYNLPLKNILEDEFGIPTIVENNVNMAALGEKNYGIGKRSRNLVYVAVSTGIGAGIILENNLYYGTHSLAGEISHMAIEKDSWGKDYGPHGCLESLISGDAMVEKIKNYIKRENKKGIISEMGEENGEISPEAIFTAAQKEDPLAKEAVVEISRYLGVAIANLTCVFDPELVILGGDILLAGELPLQIVNGVVKRLAPTRPQISLSQLGNKATIYGAVAIASKEVFRSVNSEK